MWLRAAAATLALVGVGGSTRPPDGGPPLVAFSIGSPKAIPMCRGVLVGENVLTAHHCIVAMRESGSAVYMRSALGTRKLDQTDVAGLSLTSLAAQTASVEADFNLFDWHTLKTPKPVDDLSQLYTRAGKGEQVIVEGGEGARGTCEVKATCGSMLAYTCSPATQEGWSGSPIVSADPSHRLLGIHTGAAIVPDAYHGPKLSQGVDILTIVGRSGNLFRTPEEFGNAVARSPAFSHRWAGSCETLAPAVIGDSPLSVRTIPSAPMMMHGMVAVDPDTLLAANIAKPGMSLCLLRRKEGFARWRCKPNGYPFADRVNTVIGIGAGQFAIGEALLPPKQRGPSDTSDTIAGAITIADASLADDGPSLQARMRVVSPVGSIYALRAADGHVLAGGQDGICDISPGSGECVRICAKQKCSRADDWRVNGLLLLRSDYLVAVGTDTKGHRSYPMAKWYARSGPSWKQVSQIGPTDVLLRMASEFEGRRTGLQLKAPVIIGDDLLAFGSDGGAFALREGGAPRRVGIDKLWLEPELGVDRRRIEDAVRDAIAIGPHQIAVASSDGAMHVLRMTNGTLIGDQGLTVFDRGIWTTELALAGNTLFVRSQDGNVSVVDLSRLPRV